MLQIHQMIISLLQGCNQTRLRYDDFKIPRISVVGLIALQFIEQLQGMMEERLRVYQKMNNKTLPNHILFYRDGVGDSQYGMVHDHELPQIEEAVRRVAGSNAIRITLLVVGKRHHARFFRMPNDQVKHTNFDGGICVNSDVVAPRHFNFYLQSHKSPLSTARNAHYVVIKNESAYSARELQDVVSLLEYSLLGDSCLIILIDK